MFTDKIYARRRQTLCDKLTAAGHTGLILLPGNLPAPNNYPNNTYPFRQDSTFAYYFGLDLPSLVGVIDTDSTEDTLYGNDLTVDDIIWTGPEPTLAEAAARVGVAHTAPLGALQERVTRALQQSRRLRFLPPYRGETKLQFEDLGLNPEAYSVDLLFAVAEMRERKGPEEIEELERAYLIGYEMHTLAMRMCRRGVVEREIAGAIEGISKSYGRGVSFPPIVSQHGETLHNLHSDGVLGDGRLLLVDAGAEGLAYYCSDHTRTYPVSGKFTSKQRDMYNIVLRSHDEAARVMAPGMMYMEAHTTAQRVLAEGLIGLGLIRGTAEDAVASGVIGGLFMPHGLSHGMGLDVHDCEAFGERTLDFSAWIDRAKASATCIHRATWRLQPGTVLSDEPGIYFIPALIDKCRAEGKFKGIVNYDVLDAYRDFGGIRIEDDILITETGNRTIGQDSGKKIPVTVEELETALS